MFTRACLPTLRQCIAVLALLLGGAPLIAQSGVRVRPLAAEPAAHRHVAALVRGDTADVADALREGLEQNTLCDEGAITCGQTVQGRLSADDCQPVIGDTTYGDFWIFQAQAGQALDVELVTDGFLPYLFLLDPVDVKKDEALGVGDTATLHFTADSTGEWLIIANNAQEVTGDAGDYSLTLQCSAVDPTPAAPSNLTATTVSSSTIDLAWQDNATNEVDFRIQQRVANGSFEGIGTVAANATAAEIGNLDPDTEYTFRVFARNASGNSDYSNEASATTLPESAPTPSICEPGASVMCLNGGRFQVEVSWRDSQGTTGAGSVVELPAGAGTVPLTSDDSGLFYFFQPDNWEMVVKVLQGCSLNNRYWVFAAATTNVEYTLTVTDTDNGMVRTFHNELGTRSPAVTDTNAFATCP